MEILEDDVPKKFVPSGSNDINAMLDPHVEFNPQKPGHQSTNPNSSDQIQLKSFDEVVHHRIGVITNNKSVGLEDGPSQSKRRRIERPLVVPIMSTSQHDDIVGDISLESKKQSDRDKHICKE